MVALSLIYPVVSHAPADLSTVPAELRYDWFYLSAFALMYRWSAGGAWMVLSCATALFILLPWLPPKRIRGEALRITVHPGNRDISARRDETLLEAGLRAGIAMPYECRNGGCGVCKGVILNGSIDHGSYQKSALSDEERAAGKALLCCATAQTDVELEYEEAAAERDVPLQTLECVVERMRRVADDVMLIDLKLPQGARMAYRAGQYFNVILDDDSRRAYSFASRPTETDIIEMHVRLIPGGRFTTQVFTRMQPGERLRIEGPFGRFFLRESERPIIFVAGATGFAPVKSLLEYAFETRMERRMYLYWGVRRPGDLYLQELVQRWSQEHPNFIYVPVISEARPEDGWSGRTGLVHEAILHDFADLSGYEIYTCGSVKMVETARPAYIAQGLPEDACFADAFFPAGTAAR
jgi:NAD(P)H-flavin reductase/ferredoxin